MNTARQNSAATAFTLLELLTVIAIISILMAMLFPSLSGGQEQGRRTQAMTDCKAIVAAVEHYKTEYGRLPEISGTPGAALSGPDGSVGDAAAGISNRPNSLLFDILRPIATRPTDQNPRGIRFINPARAKNQLAPKAGMQDSPEEGNRATHGCFFDPWGSQYNVVLDSDANEHTDVSPYYNVNPNNLPLANAASFALGKDKKLGDNGDREVKSNDVVSW